MADSQIVSLPAGVGKDLADGCRRGILIGAALLTLALQPMVPMVSQLSDATSEATAAATSPAPAALSAPSAPPAPAHHASADFGADTKTASAHARELADWIAATADNQGESFVVVDKQDAKLYVFDANASVRGSSAVLVGAALGDDSVPGIGTRPIADVRFEERTTPAGRFVGRVGRNSIGEDVVWVDYAAAVSMHRVRLTTPSERRQERLSSPTQADNRISYGCINVPPRFYDAHIKPIFDASRRSVVYVLPDVKSLDEVFGMSSRTAMRS